ncbi:ABC transporter permease subunit [Staphylococcus pseudintermedius]
MINMKHVFTIVYKDALDIKSDHGVLVSVFIIPFIFSLVLPLALVIGDIHFSVVDYIGGARIFIDQLPEQVIPKSIDPHHGMVYAILMYFFIPFFILIPVFVSSMLATTSFTGEKEHKTIEGLLYTPITNKELMLGKILVSGIPSILLTWIAVFVYGIIANVYGVNVLGEMIFPNFSWIMVTFFIAPLITFLSIRCGCVAKSEHKQIRPVRVNDIGIAYYWFYHFTSERSIFVWTDDFNNSRCRVNCSRYYRLFSRFEKV